MPGMDVYLRQKLLHDIKAQRVAEYTHTAAASKFNIQMQPALDQYTKVTSRQFDFAMNQAALAGDIDFLFYHIDSYRADIRFKQLGYIYLQRI